jgi:hypothetical protein
MPAHTPPPTTEPPADPAHAPAEPPTSAPPAGEPPCEYAPPAGPPPGEDGPPPGPPAHEYAPPAGAPPAGAPPAAVGAPAEPPSGGPQYGTAGVQRLSRSQNCGSRAPPGKLLYVPQTSPQDRPAQYGSGSVDPQEPAALGAPADAEPPADGQPCHHGPSSAPCSWPSPLQPTRTKREPSIPNEKYRCRCFMINYWPHPR